MTAKRATAQTDQAADLNRQALALVSEIITLLADHDAEVRRRVLETVCQFYPARLRGEPTGNGVGYMP